MTNAGLTEFLPPRVRHPSPEQRQQEIIEMAAAETQRHIYDEEARDKKSEEGNQKQANAILSTLMVGSYEVQVVNAQQKTRRHRFNKKSAISSYEQVRDAVRLKMQFERDPYAHDFAFLRFWVDVRTSLRILLDFIFSKVIVITATFIDLLSDLLFCVLYCVDLSWAFANLDDPILDTLPEPKWLWISRATETYYICVSFAIVNIVIWFCGLMVSHHKIRDTFSVLTLVHVLTSFPFLIGLTWPPAQNLYIPYYLRAVITVDRLRAVLRLRGTTRAFNFSAVTEKGILLFGSVLTVVYLGVCTYQYVEYRGGGRILGLPSSFYFVIVTLSTVGYGDVAPETVAGQVVVIGLILVALSVVPSLIAQLVETIANSKTAENEVFIATRHPHVVVIGNFDIVRRLIDVLEEVTAHSSLHQRILFLSRTPATPAVQSVISHIKYKSTVSFIVGSGTETRDLERAQLLKAAATYVLADRGARDLRREDDMNTLRVWGIHNYAPEVPLFVNNLLPETEVYQEHNTSAAICVEDLKQLILGLSVMYDGAAAFLINLLHATVPENKSNQLWQTQYGDGLKNNVYKVAMNPLFAGHTFIELAWFTYREFGMTLLCVHAWSEADETWHSVLNPSKYYKLTERDELVFIAHNAVDVELFVALTWQSYRYSMVKYRGMGLYEDPVDSSIADLHDKQDTTFALNRTASSSPSASRFSLLKDTDIKLGVPELPYEDHQTPLCHLLANKTRRESMVVEDAATWTDHVLVCTGDYHVFKFLCTLRSAAHSDSHRRVLFLCEKEPSVEESEFFAQFHDVFWMVGDPRKKRWLVAAGVYGCVKVVIMDMGSFTHDEFNGSGTIMTQHLIHHMFSSSNKQPKCIIVDMVKRSNIMYLQPSITKSATHAKKSVLRRTARHAARALHLSDARSITSKESDSVVPGPGADASHAYFYTPVYAAGRVATASMLDAMLFQLHKNACVFETVMVLAGVRGHVDRTWNGLDGVQGSWLRQMDMPSKFEGRSYGELFRELGRQEGIVPVGIQRGINEELSNLLPYFMTNPLPGMLLLTGDIVFVLIPEIT